MLTQNTERSGIHSGSSPPPGDPPARRGPATGSLLGAPLVLLLFALLPAAPPRRAPSALPCSPRVGTRQYEAAGARWLESHNQEIVHFVCEPGAPYVVSLSSASLLVAGVLPDEQPAFLEALREAVADWRALLRCPRIRAEMDSPDADTRVRFAYMDGPGTLAVGTRADEIVLNMTRRWFPGSKRFGNYGRGGRAVSFYWVVAHELGHVWGLAHSDSPSSLMYPTQCATCRWSSFEQAAGNLIHAAGLVPDWSRPHYASRFFVKTPRGVIPRLLTGELPDEPLWSSLAEQCAGESCTSTGAPALTGISPEEEPVPRSSLIGLEALRQLRRADLLDLGGPARLARAAQSARSVPGRAPTYPAGQPRATLIAMAPAPPPGPRWRDAWRACSPPLS